MSDSDGGFELGGTITPDAPPESSSDDGFQFEGPSLAPAPTVALSTKRRRVRKPTALTLSDGLRFSGR